MATRAKELSDLGNSGHLNVHDNGTVTLEGGSVGIGTTSPDAILDVRGGAASRPTFIHASGYGGIQIAGTGSGSGGALIFSNNYNTSVSEEYSIHLDGATDDLVFISGDPADIATQERMRLTDDGKVGIGTTSPVGTLHLHSADTALRLTSSDGSNTPLAQLQYSGSGGYFLRMGDSSNNEDVMIRTYGNSHFNGGNVGIGETSPLGKLHVKDGDAGSITTNGAHDTIIVEGSANTGINIFSPSTSYQYLAFGDPGGSNRGYVRYQHSIDQMVLRAGGTDTVFINDGNVGIGSSTGVSVPVSRLNVRAANNHTTGSDREDLVTFHQGISAWQVGRGAGIRWVGDVSRTMAGISAYVFGYEQTGLAFETGGATATGNLDPTTRMVIDHNGKVGIGTTSPNQSLEIQGDTPALRIHANNTSVAPNPKIELMRGTSNTFGGDAYTDWRMEVQNNARFYITSNDSTRGENVRLIINHDTGNVNIGTDISPGYKLNVQGDLRATGTIYTNTDDIRGEGVNTGLLVGDINGTFANGYGYVELHAQDTKWNQLLHYHGGTGTGSNMWRVGSYYNSSSGDNYYRFYGKGNANKNMLKLNAAEDKIELESPMVRKTTILGSQTAPVNAGPWEHITSWAISGATPTPINFNDVFNNTLFTQYKIHIHHWMSAGNNDQVYIRLLTGTNTAWTLNYHYVALHHHDFSGTHSTTTYSSDNEGRIWEGNWYQASGYGGISGEMTIDNVSSATVAGVNIDRGTNAYRPNLRSDMVGYNIGGVGGTNSYRRTIGYTRFNVGNNSSYWKGFQIYNSSNNNVLGGSAISVYGLKAPT